KSLERSMGCPQDVEWAIDADLPEDDNLVALQSRPETVWSQKKKQTTAVYETGIAGVLGTLLAPIQAKR
ncbi:PEP/pyruvate-binding domain-containing protein, partial [Bradyrhizobium sp.]